MSNPATRQWVTSHQPTSLDGVADRAQPAGSVAAVTLNWNQASLTLRCVASVRSQVDHVFVVDNDSRPSDKALLAGLNDDHTTVIENRTNLGYAGGCNEGISAALEAGYTAILILNNDAFPDPGSIGLLASRLAAAPEVGAVGPAVVRCPTREVLHVACTLNHRTGRTGWLDSGTALEALATAPAPTGYLSGEAILMRSAVIREIGMFEPRYFCYYEDVDWSIRTLRAGWKIEVVPRAIFEHIVSASSAGHRGVYFRARNLPLMLRTTCGRTRLAAFALSARTEMLWFAWYVRRGKLALALREVLGGWLAGLALSG